MQVDLGNGVLIPAEPGSQRTRTLMAMGHPLVDDAGDELGVADLRAQIDDLNADRADGDQISKAGRKADLIARIAAALAGTTTAPAVGEAPPSR